MNNVFILEGTKQEAQLLAFQFLSKDNADGADDEDDIAIFSLAFLAEFGGSHIMRHLRKSPNVGDTIIHTMDIN